MGDRSVEVSKSLAAVGSGIGTLVSFSTQPENVAPDGTGHNSPSASKNSYLSSICGDSLETDEEKRAIDGMA